MNEYIKRTYHEVPEKFYEANKFKDVKVGQRYIPLPIPGDNNGHGGFKNSHYIFQKIKEEPPSNYNSVRTKDGLLAIMPENMEVITLE